MFFLEAYVETSNSYSTVIFHSRAGERPRSCVETSEKFPPNRKTSLSAEMLSTGGRNGNSDENDNLDFIHEEIAPGMNKRKIMNSRYLISFSLS